jgi:hypothetical protein
MGIGFKELLILLLIPALFYLTYRLGYRSGRIRGERDMLKKINESNNK